MVKLRLQDDLARAGFESNVNSQDGKTGIEALRRVFKFESNVNSQDGKTKLSRHHKPCKFESNVNSQDGKTV